MKPALTGPPQFTFLSAVHTVMGQPTSSFVADTVTPLNSVKVHIKKGEFVTKPLLRKIYW